jgi:predicted small lipoprotein YifL
MRNAVRAVALLMTSMASLGACGGFGTAVTPEADAGVDAAPARFCPGGADALFCADFDAADAFEGWDLRSEKLGGTLAGIKGDPSQSCSRPPSSRSRQGPRTNPRPCS